MKFSNEEHSVLQVAASRHIESVKGRIKFLRAAEDADFTKANTEMLKTLDSALRKLAKARSISYQP